jgi:hypothetical protein
VYDKSSFVNHGAVAPQDGACADTEWKDLLDSPGAPAQPDWIQPLVPKKP